MYGRNKILPQIKQSQGTSFKAEVEKRKLKDDLQNEWKQDYSEDEWTTVVRKKAKNNGKSDEEKAFLQLQQRFLELLAIPTKNRTEEEKKEYNSLRNKYSKGKVKYPHLVQDKNVSTGAKTKASNV